MDIDIDKSLFKRGNVFKHKQNGRLYMLCKVGYKRMQFIDLYSGASLTSPISVEITYDLLPTEIKKLCDNKEMKFHKESDTFYSEIKP